MTETLFESKKIVWLASYPKSGNTWFRAFLTALLNDGKVDINNMPSDGIFSSSKLFTDYTGLDPALLYQDEINALRSNVFNLMAEESPKAKLFNKIHDAYTFTSAGLPLIPSESTLCAIYIIRNPLDIVSSFANHMNSSIDEAIKTMNDPGAYIVQPLNSNNIHAQFNQILLGWSDHVKSWTANLPFPVFVLRYEDMLNDTIPVFKKAIDFIGIDTTLQNIESALAATSFKKLQKEEMEKGFNEKSVRNSIFFRKGVAGGWEHELSEKQIRLIVENHKKVMKLFNYIPNG